MTQSTHLFMRLLPRMALVSISRSRAVVSSEWVSASMRICMRPQRSGLRACCCAAGLNLYAVRQDTDGSHTQQLNGRQVGQVVSDW